MSEQLRIVSLNCTNCGGVLEIHGDMDRFACGYCGSAQIVERRGGTVALRLMVDAVARVQVGTDKTAAELAIVRLEREIASTYAQWQTDRNRVYGIRLSFSEILRESFKGENILEARLAQVDAPYRKRLHELTRLIEKKREIVDGP